MKMGSGREKTDYFPLFQDLSVYIDDLYGKMLHFLS